MTLAVLTLLPNCPLCTWSSLIDIQTVYRRSVLHPRISLSPRLENSPLASTCSPRGTFTLPHKALLPDAISPSVTKFSTPVFFRYVGPRRTVTCFLCCYRDYILPDCVSVKVVELDVHIRANNVWCKLLEPRVTTRAFSFRCKLPLQSQYVRCERHSFARLKKKKKRAWDMPRLRHIIKPCRIDERPCIRASS